MAARLIVHNDTEFDYTGGWTIWFSLLFKKGTWDENTIISPNDDLGSGTICSCICACLF